MSGRPITIQSSTHVWGRAPYIDRRLHQSDSSRFRQRLLPICVSTTTCKFTIASVLLIWTFFLPAQGYAATLTFDDLPTCAEDCAVPNGYGGVTWINFDYFTPPTVYDPGFFTPGYLTGTVSSPNVAYNLNAKPAHFASPTPFTLDSGYFTGGWNDGLTVTVTGLLNGTPVASKSFVVNTTAPSLISFNWTGINEVDFSSSGGVPNPLYAPYGVGTNFALDNLTVSTGISPPPSAHDQFVAGFKSLQNNFIAPSNTTTPDQLLQNQSLELSIADSTLMAAGNTGVPLNIDHIATGIGNVVNIANDLYTLFGIAACLISRGAACSGIDPFYIDNTLPECLLDGTCIINVDGAKIITASSYELFHYNLPIGVSAADLTLFNVGDRYILNDPGFTG